MKPLYLATMQGSVASLEVFRDEWQLFAHTSDLLTAADDPALTKVADRHVADTVAWVRAVWRKWTDAPVGIGSATTLIRRVNRSEGYALCMNTLVWMPSESVIDSLVKGGIGAVAYRDPADDLLKVALMSESVTYRLPCTTDHCHFPDRDRFVELATIEDGIVSREWVGEFADPGEWTLATDDCEAFFATVEACSGGWETYGQFAYL